METLTFDDGAIRHDVLSRPIEHAPPADAPYDERAAWAERYIAWYLMHAPSPPEVDRDHLYQVEFNTCVLDPQEYERDTQVELSEPVLH
jgi:hypothetical protein